MAGVFYCLGASGCGTTIGKRDVSFWVDDWPLHVTNGCDKICGHGQLLEDIREKDWYKITTNLILLGVHPRWPNKQQGSEYLLTE